MGNISVIIWMNNEHEYKNVINLILRKIIWISSGPGNKGKCIAKSLLKIGNKNIDKICLT